MGKKLVTVELNGYRYNYKSLAEKFPYFVRWVLRAIGGDAARELVEYIKNSGVHFRSTKKNDLGIPLTGGTFAYPRSFKNKKGQVKEYQGKYRHKSSGWSMVSFKVNKNNRSVEIKSFPLNIYRTGNIPVRSRRTEGEHIMRSFKSSYNPVSAAKRYVEKIMVWFFNDTQEQSSSK